MNELTLSSLGHTWFLDLDGTIVKHNGYKVDGHDTLLDGAIEFIQNLPTDDMIVFITSRSYEYKESTEKFLDENGVRYDSIIYNTPFGERILVNDCKPSGLKTAFAVNGKRDGRVDIMVRIDEKL